MTKLDQEELKEITKLPITIILHPNSNLVELWINNVFIAHGDKMYINHYIENEATIFRYFPEDGMTTEDI